MYKNNSLAVITNSLKYLVSNPTYFIDIVDEFLIISLIRMLVRMIPSHDFLLSLLHKLRIEKFVLSKRSLRTIIGSAY